MKKICGILAGLLLFASSASATVMTFENWGFNPQGADASSTFGQFGPIDQMTILGTSLINPTDGSTATSGGFVQYGTYEATSFQNDSTTINNSTSGLGAFGFPGSVGYEITFELFDTAGTYALGADGVNHLTFTEAKFNVYLDTTDNYGSTDATYGADDGVLIAAFELQSGNGTMNFGANGGPDGSTDLTFAGRSDVAGLADNGLKAGVWFDDNGTDMSTFDPNLIVMSMVDGNNEIVAVDESGSMFTEYDGQDGLESMNYTDPSQGFFVQTDGSFAPGAVPEPTTMVLLGIGLLGIAAIGRKKEDY